MHVVATFAPRDTRPNIAYYLYGGYLRTLSMEGRERLIQFYELLGFSGVLPIAMSEIIPFRMVASVGTLMQNLEQQIIVKFNSPAFCNQELHGAWKPVPDDANRLIFSVEDACKVDETRT